MLERSRGNREGDWIVEQNLKTSVVTNRSRASRCKEGLREVKI